MNKAKKIMLGVTTAVVGLSPMVAFAAADPEVTNAATDLGTSIQENTVAGIQAYLPLMGVVIGLVLVIFLGIRLFRRVAR